ncbi:site-specific DNA-methyltransferase [Candidatus Poribacteria bacterium]|nr:site-specific DNA-methyltransferase [Candidatus Poribacteria bacterium]
MLSIPSVYTTSQGSAYLGESLALVRQLPPKSVDLAITSPPFALQRQKEYGNREEAEYVDWLLPFCAELRRVLKPEGSLVIDLGGAYLKNRPVRSLYNFRLLIRLCDEQGWRLAEEFFWFNPAKLPSPIEWVNKRKIRAKDAVDTIWWLSQSDFPRANISQVLAPYSDRMKLLLRDRDKYYSPKKRPSGHDIGKSFEKDNGGAIPPNLLQIPNTESNSEYLRRCKEAGVPGHPARFPEALPEFFIKFLTSPGDLVLDFFAGSNTTGSVAERLGRRWLAFESSQEYLATSVFRFCKSDDSALNLRADLAANRPAGINVRDFEEQLLLFERPARYSTLPAPPA